MEKEREENEDVKLVPLSIRLPKTLVDAIIDEGKKEKRSKTGQIHFVLDKYLKEVQGETAEV